MNRPKPIFKFVLGDTIKNIDSKKAIMFTKEIEQKLKNVKTFEFFEGVFEAIIDYCQTHSPAIADDNFSKRKKSVSDIKKARFVYCRMLLTEKIKEESFITKKLKI